MFLYSKVLTQTHVRKEICTQKSMHTIKLLQLNPARNGLIMSLLFGPFGNQCDHEFASEVNDQVDVDDHVDHDGG